MNVETLLVAVIVAVISPAVLALLTGRQRRAEKREDWARQDAVAARVATVAQTAADAQDATTTTLRQIHTLVNSDMTAARTESLAMVRALIVALKAVPVKDRDEEAISLAEARARELESILADRLVAQRKVEADAAAVT